MKKGKSKEAATEITQYLEGLAYDQEAILSENNLIMLVPKMDVKVLPDEQVMFYHKLLKEWLADKENNKKSVAELTLDEIKTMDSLIEDEMKDRNLKND